VRSAADCCWFWLLFGYSRFVLGEMMIKRFTTLLVVAGLLAGCSFNVKLPPLTTPSSTDLIDASLIEIAVTQSNQAANTSDEIESLVYPTFSFAAGDKDAGDKIVSNLNNAIKAQVGNFRIAAAQAFDENSSEQLSSLEISVRKIWQDADFVLVDTYSCEHLAGAAHGLCVPLTRAFSATDGAAFTFDELLQPGKQDAFYDFVVANLFEQVAPDLLFSESEVRETIGEESFEGWWPYGSSMSFEFSPYEVAPYSSGAITIDLMMDEIAEFFNPNSELAELLVSTQN
jgi:hypothetical protein